MEAIVARDPAPEVPPEELLRDPLSWAALAAVAGAAVGLVGTFRRASLISSYDFDLSAELYTGAMEGGGQAIAALSLLAVPVLIGGPRARGLAGRTAAVVGMILLVASAAATAAALYYLWHLNTGEMRYSNGPPPALARASFWASLLLPPTVVAPFALLALALRRWRLGALVSCLCASTLPLGLVFRLFPSLGRGDGEMVGLALFGFLGWGVSLPEAALWGLLGVVLLRASFGRSRGLAARSEAEENRGRARRLYEEGLGNNDPSAVDELVSEDFRDLRRGSRGRLAMERLVADLWASYPDLEVSVEGQEAEGDLVRTRLVLSGTDRGSGVMWYPPTGWRVSFKAEFVDRFRRGELVEHAGEADTEELLRQLGHHEGGPSDSE